MIKRISASCSLLALGLFVGCSEPAPVPEVNADDFRSTTEASVVPMDSIEESLLEIEGSPPSSDERE